jgi:hypothetical protein
MDIKPFDSLGKLVKDLREAFKVPLETLKLAKSLLKDGCLEVETPVPGMKGHAFKSILQIDADIITYIPDVRKYKKDKEKLEAIQKGHEEHTKAVHKTISKLSTDSNFLARGFDGLLIALNFYPILNLLQEFSTENGLYSGGTIALSLIFRKFIRPIVSKQGMKLVFKFAKRFISKKFK